MEKSGLLLVDKPIHLTSHDVVAKVRKWLGQKSVGHAGTLDPLATGLLVLLCGKATKLSDYVLSGDKGYQVKVQFGVTSDTDDIMGEMVRSEAPPKLSEAEITDTVTSLSGALHLSVPIYSAIKQNGKKLYELARKNVAVEAPVRNMTVYSPRVLEVGESWVKAEFRCSKGTYVRSWARELGHKLGCGAVVEELRRTYSAPYEVDAAIPLHDLLAMDPAEEALSKFWISLEKSLPQCPSVKIEGREERLIVNGQIPRRLERYLEIEFGAGPELLPGIKVLSRKSGKLLSILSHESPLNFKIKRVFPS